MAANLGLLTPASAQTNNIVFLATAEATNSAVINAKAAFQAEATAQGLNFVDGTGDLSGTGTLPVDSNTKVLVLLSGGVAISASSLAQIADILTQNPGLEVLAFIDNSVRGNDTSMLSIYQSIAPSSWAPMAISGVAHTGFLAMPLNTLSAYTTSSSFAALPQIFGDGYAVQNVPTDYALYVNPSFGTTTTTPTTDNVYGLFIPHALSNNGSGACVFYVSDFSLFAYGSPQSNAVAQAFTSAALDPNGACALTPTVQFTKVASTTDGLTSSGTVVYTLTAKNIGSATATNIVVDDPIPDGIDSYSWTCDGADCPAPTTGSTPLNQTIASMAVGDSVTYTITATVVSSSVPDLIKNSATLSGNLVCGDGTAQPCLAEVTNPFTQADMQASGPVAVSAKVNTPITVTTTCTNNDGPTPATNVTCDVSGAPTGATTVCTPTVPVDSLAVNAVISCDTTFTPSSAAPITLVTTAGSDTPDLNHANDTANTTITPVATFIAPASASIPTLSEIALLLLAALLGVTAVAVHRRGR